MLKFIEEIKKEPLVLAHHPLCGKFDDHFFIIRNKKVCRGCLVVYPTALVTLMILFILGVDEFKPLILGAIFLFLINLTRLVIPRTPQTNIVFNVILGITLALTIMSVIYCPEELRISVYPLIIIISVIFIYSKGLKVHYTCKQCSNNENRPNCFLGPQK